MKRKNSLCNPNHKKTGLYSKFNFFVFLFLVLQLRSNAQQTNDNACRALEIPCTPENKVEIIDELDINTIISSFGTYYTVGGSQCANLPYKPTLFYKVTVNTAGLFTFSTRIGTDNVDNNGYLASIAPELISSTGVKNYAVWKNVDCNDIMAGTAPYPIRISVKTAMNNSCPYYCRGVNGLDVGEPSTNNCENGNNSTSDGKLAGFNVVPGDVIIIALNDIPVGIQMQGPNGLVNIPTPFQIVVGGKWGGGGGLVKCCQVDFNLSNTDGEVKNQFCLGEKVYLNGTGSTSSKFKIQLLSVDNSIIDEKNFSSSSLNNIEITNVFPSGSSDFQKFQIGVNYKLKVEAQGPCGCSGVFLDFNFTCCDIDKNSKLFSLKFINEGEPPTPKLIGTTHVFGDINWYAWSVSPDNGLVNHPTYPPIHIGWPNKIKNFGMPATSQCYMVKLEVTNQCATFCSTQKLCNFNCSDKECNLSKPSNVDYSNGIFSWDPVPGAVGYLLEYVICDPECCGSSSNGISSANDIIYVNVNSTSHTLGSTDFVGLNYEGIPPCFSWKVSAVCADRKTSMWAKPDAADLGCIGEFNSIFCMNRFSERSSVFTTNNTKNIPLSEINHEVDLVPNPANSSFQLKLPGNSQESLHIDFEIIDSRGINIKSYKNVTINNLSKPISYNIENLAKGLYIVKIITSDEKIFIKKLIIN